MPFIYGTLVSSTLALIIAVPLSLGVALCLSEMAPVWLSRRLGFMVELLAAIPSVVYGLWAIFVLGPWLRDHVEPPLGAALGFMPLFQGPRVSVSILCAGVLLAIMVVPYIAAVCTDVFRAVPQTQREAALALGATRWEMVRMAVLPYGLSGVIGAIMLGLGRALGETIAVAMVIGNSPQISASLFAPSATLASVIANEFAEATSTLYLSSLVELGLVLLVVGLALNVVARAAGAGRHAAPLRGRPVTAKSAAHTRRTMWRKAKSDLMMGVTVLATVITLLPLFIILAYLFAKGASSLNLAFFTHMPAPVGEKGGGMANAIVGTLELIGLASLMGVPIGIGSGLYLAAHRGGRLASAARFGADVMMGVPSIVVGIFAYAVVVRPMGGFSTMAGAVALAVIMIPLVTRTTEEMLLLVPHELREAALALGVPGWRTTLWVVARTAASGIATGAILAIARIAGETAPLLFTAFGNRFWSTSLTNPIASLTVQVYTYAISPFPDWQRQAWAGALVLTAIVLALELGVRWVTRGSARVVR